MNAPKQTISARDFWYFVKTTEWWTDRLECFQAIDPVYSRYETGARELLAGGVWPVWRVDGERRAVLGGSGVPASRAFPISFAELAALPELIAQPPLGFDPSANYYARSNHVAIAHCDGCGVRIVKYGHRRLLQSAIRNTDERLFVYEAASADWSACRTGDMRHFCRCGGHGAPTTPESARYPVNPPGSPARRPRG